MEEMEVTMQEARPKPTVLPLEPVTQGHRQAPVPSGSSLEVQTLDSHLEPQAESESAPC